MSLKSPAQLVPRRSAFGYEIRSEPVRARRTTTAAGLGDRRASPAQRSCQENMRRRSDSASTTAWQCDLASKRQPAWTPSSASLLSTSAEITNKIATAVVAGWSVTRTPRALVRSVPDPVSPTWPRGTSSKNGVLVFKRRRRRRRHGAGDPRYRLSFNSTSTMRPTTRSGALGL